mgnify:CR=1 FL=1
MEKKINNIDREEFIELHLIQGLTEAQCAVRFNVSKSTIANYKRQEDLKKSDRWQYIDVYCAICECELDPDRELTNRERKRLVNRKHKYCDDCEDEYKRRYNAQKQAEWRERNREKYNAYQREWRRKNKDRWKKIKKRSRERNKEE